MVVTIALETDEAKAAADAATDGIVLLVPRTEGDYARVGTVAKIEDRGELRGGILALVVRGLHRAVIGAGVPGSGSALWVQTERVEEREPSERARELARASPGV